MKIRPGRTRSLLGGLAALLVTIAGAAMMSSLTPSGGPFGIFLMIWVIVGLVAAGASFYNAFSERGLPLYEVEPPDSAGQSFCPQCGRVGGTADEFCRHCGAHLGHR